MHEGPARLAVAVDERMNGLELGIGDGGMGHGRQLVETGKVQRCSSRSTTFSGGRRDEGV